MVLGPRLEESFFVCVYFILKAYSGLIFNVASQHIGERVMFLQDKLWIFFQFLP